MRVSSICVWATCDGIGVVELQILRDLLEGEPQVLAAQDQHEPRPVAARVGALGAAAHRRDQALGLVEADGAGRHLRARRPARRSCRGARGPSLAGGRPEAAARLAACVWRSCAHLRLGFPAPRPPRPSALSSRACRSSSWAARRGTRSRRASRSWRCCGSQVLRACSSAVAAGPGLQLDECLRRLAALLVLDADHRHLVDGADARRSPPRCGADRRCSPSR